MLKELFETKNLNIAVYARETPRHKWTHVFNIWTECENPRSAFARRLWQDQNFYKGQEFSYVTWAREFGYICNRDYDYRLDYGTRVTTLPDVSGAKTFEEIFEILEV